MEKTKAPARILLILLAVVMVVGAMLPCISVSAESRDESENKTYEIVVAYDNSYSMYNGTDIWCQAKYAMEIFASMLDYDNGDKLTIFPMHPVFVDGTNSGQKAGNTTSVTVDSPEDIDLISKLYTPTAGGTPFTCVENAYSYLLNESGADEKWLIALTDGVYRKGTGGGKEPIIPKQDIQNRLREMSFSGINVQYLAIFDPDTTEKIPNGDIFTTMTVDDVSLNFAGEKDLYADVVQSSDELKIKLIEICNTIFKRDELPISKLQGRTLTLDISMKNLIVFVQGKNAKVTGLEDSEGNKISVLTDSNQRKFSTISCGDNGVGDQYDNTLYGHVLTFGECAKGTYTLNYTDADTIRIFYEPDVLLNVTLLDTEGNVVEPDSDTFEEGDYTLKAEIVDRITGEDVSRAELMGGNVNIDLNIGYEGEDPFSILNGGNFSLKVGDNVKALVTATYLDKYKLTNEDDPSIFPNPFRVIPKGKRLEIAASSEQAGNRYSTMTHGSWKPVRVDLTLAGKPLTDDELAAVKFDIGFKEDAKNPEPPVYKMKLLKGESAAEIYVAKNKDGKYVSPEKGDYEMNISATLEDEYGRPLKDNDAVDIQIRALPIWFVSLIVVFSAVAVVVVCGIPVRPMMLFFGTSDPDVVFKSDVFGISNTRSIELVSGINTIVLEANVKVEPKWFKNSWIKNILRSRDMTYRLTNITLGRNITTLMVSGTKITPKVTELKDVGLTSVKWKEKNTPKTKTASITVNKAS